MRSRLVLLSLLVAARAAFADSSLPGEPRDPAPPAGEAAVARCGVQLERARAELSARHPFFSDGKIAIVRGALRWETVGPKKPWQAGGGNEKYLATFQPQGRAPVAKPEWTGMRTWVSGGPPSLGFRRGGRGYVAAYEGEGDAVDDFARAVKAELDRCLGDGDRAATK